ncbi:hypothetical protein D6C84_10139 [Aureobasidium pullulans]|uniref:Rhodopsin domain-containing protein n=1 Tax=Aureobasidium pullulans TaxID=5580 RepID=A0A4S9X290_AURPU|nr:hypothetical protein D6C84_10139 [Aureobasidium pullulans]
MGAFSLEFQHELQRESWALYALGIVVIALRICARARKLGLRHLEFDDYLILVAALFYTLLIITLNLTAQGGGTALAMPGEDVFALTAEEIKIREKGAKIDLVAEQAMLNVIWILKVCTLKLYSRLTMGLKQQVAVKILAVYTAIGWVACQLAYFCECRPFSMYWQIAPSPPVNCMVFYAYAIVQGTFNISSDVFMLIIPFPLILQVSIGIKQKLVLLCIFSMGIFVIIAASLTKAEFFRSIYAEDYMFWYTREASVAVYVANLPCIWPLLREALPALKSWTPGFISSSAYKRRGASTTGLTAQHRTRNTQKSNLGLSRRSMDDFHAIIEPTRPQEAKTTTNVHTREINSYHHTRSAARGSSSESSVDDLPLHGIMASTTIEMSVMASDRKEDDRDDASQSSTRAFAYDIERGLPRDC